MSDRYNDMNKEQLNDAVKKNYKEAELLLNDEDKMEKFLERLERKLKRIPKVGDKLAVVPMFISLIRSYIKKEYQDIPLGSIIAIVSALIYLLSPIDLIPDCIPGAGYIDDVAVVAFVFNMVEDDVEEYKKWQVSNGKRIIEY